MSTSSLNFPNASKSFMAMNAGLLGMQGLPKTPNQRVVRTEERIYGEGKGVFTLKVDHIATSVSEKELSAMAATPCRFTIPGEPMGAPRQSRCDAWRPRPVVLRYREWKDKARACAPAGLPKEPMQVLVIAYLPMPASWSKKKKNAMAGEFHRVKPDGDNIFKGAADALWEQDSCIAVSRVEKRWCWPGEERLEVEVLP